MKDKKKFKEMVTDCGDNLVDDGTREQLLETIGEDLANIEVLCRVAYAHPELLDVEYDNVWGAE